jgi:sugar phosphate isomerase/epimerase
LLQIAMITANYFARATGYRSSMEEWGAAERRVIERASLEEFNAICADVAGAGFKYMELWMAHAFPKFMTPDLADELRKIWEAHGLTVIGYSCSLGDPVRWPRWTRLIFETCRMLGIKKITSGISKEAAPAIYGYCREYDMQVACENHPEKHPDEIRAIIGDYGDRIGACADTGWFATQGFPAPDAIRALKDVLRHIHLKDVRQAGEHHSVRLGGGTADIAGCIEAIREIGYDGTISIEQESGDHDPTEECAEALRWLKREFPHAT